MARRRHLLATWSAHAGATRAVGIRPITFSSAHVYTAGGDGRVRVWREDGAGVEELAATGVR